MSALTPFGILHTLVSLVGLGTGVAALVKYRTIDPATTLGRLSLGATFVSAVSGLGIFHHGGFGPPHVLSVLTILVIGLGTTANRTTVFGGASHKIQTVSFSATILFHLIPAITETTTRLPQSAPLASGPNEPALQVTNAILLIAFVIGVILQLRLVAPMKTMRRP